MENSKKILNFVSVEGALKSFLKSLERVLFVLFDGFHVNFRWKQQEKSVENWENK
jgi:hypothetical protein